MRWSTSAELHHGPPTPHQVHGAAAGEHRVACIREPSANCNSCPITTYWYALRRVPPSLTRPADVDSL
jgi:hypothetical protein